MGQDLESESKAKPNYYSARVLTVALPTVYVSILCVFCVAYRIIPGPELIVLCFFIYAAYTKRTRRFAADWIPFVALFVSYEAMNGIVGSLPTAGRLNIVQPINADLRLFGTLPTVVLQQLCRSPFLDYLAAFFYSLHFIAPTLFAFILWRYHPQSFQKYTLALGVGTYSALITFLVYPVAPPWYGIPIVDPSAQVTRILLQVDNSIGIPFYRTIFDYISSNPFAAFPSLHAMYPWLISLFALKIKKTRALPILLFPVGVWFSAVYLGEHYVIDVIGGILYGTCAFLLVEKLVPFLAGMRHK